MIRKYIANGNWSQSKSDQDLVYPLTESLATIKYMTVQGLFQCVIRIFSFGKLNMELLRNDYRTSKE